MKRLRDVPEDVRAEVVRLRAAGAKFRDIAEATGLSPHQARRIVRAARAGDDGVEGESPQQPNPVRPAPGRRCIRCGRALEEECRGLLRIFVAGERGRLRGVRDRIHAEGVGTVVSTWLDRPREAATPEGCAEEAQRDLLELSDADIVALETAAGGGGFVTYRIT